MEIKEVRCKQVMIHTCKVARKRWHIPMTNIHLDCEPNVVKEFYILVTCQLWNAFCMFGCLKNRPSSHTNKISILFPPACSLLACHHSLPAYSLKIQKTMVVGVGGELHLLTPLVMVSYSDMSALLKTEVWRHFPRWSAGITGRMLSWSPLSHLIKIAWLW